MEFGGTGNEITAMSKGRLTAPVLHPSDNGGLADADAFIAHMNGETPDLNWGGAVC